jgi:ankyrin repeat protein
MSSSSHPRSRLNLEQQRKRAKDLRRAHREGRLEAAERIAAHLPRARGQTAAQVLASAFRLGDAQLVVAREAGFPSWPQLKRQLELSQLGIEGALEALLDAALAGETDAVRTALAVDPQLPRRSIHAAAALGDAEAARALLEGAPRLSTERGGLRQWTPLIYCCSARHGRDVLSTIAARVQIAQALLARGASASDETTSHESPGGFRSVLQGAAREVASAELVALLLDHGAALLATNGTAGPPLALTDAVAGGDLPCLERLLAARPDSWQVREALEVAVFHDRPDMARALLEHEAHPDDAGRWWGHGGSCLHAAILLGRGRPLLDVLLAGGVDLLATDRDDRTAYAVAVRTGHDVAAELLRARGARDAEVDAIDRLIAACVRGDGDGVRRLLAEDPGSKGRYRYTDHLMLGWAIKRGRPEALSLLLQAGLDPDVPDPDGQTALHLAVAADDPAAIALLRAAGASPELRDFSGRTPAGESLPLDEQRERDELFERAADAVAFGDLDTLRELLDDEPELVRWRSPRTHRATLLIYCGANGTEHPRQRMPANAPAVARLLLERGAEVNAACRLYGGGPGATTLAMVLTSSYTMDTPDEGELVQVLLAAGARLDLTGDPKSSLWHAIGWGARRSFAALVATGIPLDDPWLAAAANDVGRLEQLLSDGADVNARNSGGLTPLHAAALMGHLEAATFLLAHGADPTARDTGWNATPAAKARWRGHHALAALLE